MTAQANLLTPASCLGYGGWVKVAVSLLTVLTLTLSACAPTVMGTQSYNPVVQTTATAPTIVAPGQTVYVQYTYPGDALGVPDSRFDALDINFSSASTSDKVIGPEAEAAWLRMSASDLPAGVQVSLVRATIAKPVSTTTTSGGSVRVTYREVIRVLLKVTASEQATKGLEIADLTFADGAATGTVPFTVIVR